MQGLPSDDAFSGTSGSWELLREISDALATRIVSAAPLPTAGFNNNRLSLLMTADYDRLVLKRYFRDERRRGEREWQALGFLWEVGVRCLPQPLFRSSGHDATVFSHVEGRTLQSDRATLLQLDAAGRCYATLARWHPASLKRTFPEAVGAALSLQHYTATIRQRLAHLQQEATSAAPALRTILQAQDVVHSIATLLEELERSAAGRNDSVARAEWVLSNGDCGPHNILVRPSGALCLLDFENAGWEDPHAVIASFMTSDRSIGLPLEAEEALIAGYCGAAQVHWQPERYRLLLALNQVAWCAIYLQSATPSVLIRKCFADPLLDVPATVERQIERYRTRWPIARAAAGAVLG
ncbi:MAG: aminoglycoside phosphotransferase family protein [Chloroflexi bacterium]|nr:aminoglycoside phosphotransferase family protein [Chloroflexota bacterium]